MGAHESGLIGEDPNGPPNNLMPFISQVAVGKRAQLSVFGNDYPTADGTGVRDYIHVMDLADGHVKALQYLQQQPGLVTVNLGTGQGYSVLQMVQAFSEINQVAVPYQIVARRPGDIAECYADPAKAKALLGWQAQSDPGRYGAGFLALAAAKSGWLSNHEPGGLILDRQVCQPRYLQQCQ